MSENTESAIRYERGDDGVVTLVLDDPTASANTMNDLYRASMATVLDRLESEEGITGVVITSAKKTFFAGGNLNAMKDIGPEQAGEAFAMIESVKSQLRRLEKLPVPVVSCINGAALGGGLEICLATNRRIAVDGPGVVVGLPEVSLGLLPGGGGVTRTVRLLGLQSALLDVLLAGKQFKAALALEKGLVDELVPSADELVPAAKAWIQSVADDEDAGVQPWDRKGYKMPGGTPRSPALASFLPAFPAMLRKQLKGAHYPAPKAIMSAAVEGAQVDFDAASRIESRYFTSLVTGQNAKNMIQAFFFDLQALNGTTLRPEGHDTFTATKVGVLGAGMMGAGIAYSCARAGMQVVLKDISTENAEKGKAYSQKILDKAVDRQKSTPEKRDELLARIHPTGDAADLAGCDLIIEAVFEDPGLKAKVFAEVLEVVDDDALLCSNTSTLPITELSSSVDRPADFVGLHFFSPVDKMPLVEIIRGEHTGEAAIAKAIDVVQQLRKTPIVVNDSRGFYTSRVIGTFVNEGIAMLAEGVNPFSIERAATQAGYPVGTLQLSDELNMELMAKIRNASRASVEETGGTYDPHPAEQIIDAMIEAGRPGRLRGAGFYDYDENGKRLGFWAELTERFPTAEDQPAIEDLRDRLLVIEALETAKCFEEGVLTSSAAANIGAIMGIGYPPPTGGTAQYMVGYEDHSGRRGLSGFVDRARELAKHYGERFEPTPYLVAMAEKGETFPC